MDTKVEPLSDFFGHEDSSFLTFGRSPAVQLLCPRQGVLAPWVTELLKKYSAALQGQGI